MNLQDCIAYFERVQELQGIALLNPKGKIVEHNFPVLESEIKKTVGQISMMVKAVPKKDRSKATLSTDLGSKKVYYASVPSGALMFLLGDERGLEYLEAKCNKFSIEHQMSPPTFVKSKVTKAGQLNPKSAVGSVAQASIPGQLPETNIYTRPGLQTESEGSKKLPLILGGLALLLAGGGFFLFKAKPPSEVESVTVTEEKEVDKPASKINKDNRESKPDASVAKSSSDSDSGKGFSGSQKILIKKNANWAFFDEGEDLTGTGWRGFNYDHSSWSKGEAPLGYDDVNGVELGSEISFGDDAEKKHITTYFRHTFNFPKKQIKQGAVKGLLLRDDGAIVYLNGKEIFRSNMPEGPAKYKMKALKAVSGKNEGVYHKFKFYSSKLKKGKNVLAVEIHQNNGRSSDLGFALELKMQN